MSLEEGSPEQTEGGEEQDTSQDQVKLSELLDETKKKPKVTTKVAQIDEDRQSISEQELRERETFREGQEKYFTLRDKWSGYIYTLVFMMVSFQIMLTFAIGFHWVDLTKYSRYLYLVMGENFAQILGMGYIVAHHLFPNPKPKNKITPTAPTPKS